MHEGHEGGMKSAIIAEVDAQPWFKPVITLRALRAFSAFFV
jgi:hypothetical protein